ncbi:MAG: hypothetical protein ACD_48C00016G0005 [uncultured bacterium]|nr:MAG: hypothetical protein ACD_48C00016G0005 [uncultured bacterium]
MTNLWEKSKKIFVNNRKKVLEILAKILGIITLNKSYILILELSIGIRYTITHDQTNSNSKN